MITEIIIAIFSVVTTIFSIKFFIIFPLEKRLKKFDERLDKVDKTLEEVKKDIRSIDNRVNFLQGYLQGRDSKGWIVGK